MLVREYDIAWAKGRCRALCACGWLSPPRACADRAADAHALHRPECPLHAVVLRPRPSRPPKRHWHLAESQSGGRLFSRLRRRRISGSDSAGEVFRRLAERVSELVLRDWSLVVEETSDTVAVLASERRRRRIEVMECWDGDCLAAHPMPIAPAHDRRELDLRA